MADKRMTEEDVVAELRDGMTIGIPQFRDRGELKLGRLLLQPFRTEGK